MTQDDINAIAKATAHQVWAYLLGNIATNEMDEAGDIMRRGAYNADQAQQFARTTVEQTKEWGT